MKISTESDVTLNITIESLNDLRYLYGCFDVMYETVEENSLNCPIGWFIWASEFEKTQIALFEAINKLVKDHA